MQNVVKRKNMYLEGFQVILNSFPHNHMFYSILNLLFCIMKNYLKKNSNFCRCPQKYGFCPTGGSQKVTIWPFLTPSLTL